jgi:predicted nucleic acid-binding protein
MKEIPIIDANIVLRFLTNDIPKQADRCTGLLQRIESGSKEVWLPDLILTDIVWTLEKFYKQPKQRIQELLIPILELKGLRHNNKKISKLAFQLYVEKNIDWIDAFVVAQMITQKKREIYSYDSDFDKVDDINRLEP